MSSFIIPLSIGVLAIIWVSIRNRPAVLKFGERVMVALGFRPNV